jgi:hypothetical protein
MHTGFPLYGAPGPSFLHELRLLAFGNACYNAPMPAKKTSLTDAERAKRIRETAREIGTDNDPKSLERVFDKVVRPKGSARKPNPRRVGC